MSFRKHSSGPYAARGADLVVDATSPERLKTELPAEAFNVTNTAQFTNPDSNLANRNPRRESRCAHSLRSAAKVISLIRMELILIQNRFRWILALFFLLLLALRADLYAQPAGTHNALSTSAGMAAEKDLFQPASALFHLREVLANTSDTAWPLELILAKTGSEDYNTVFTPVTAVRSRDPAYGGKLETILESARPFTTDKPRKSVQKRVPFPSDEDLAIISTGKAGKQ